MLEFFILYFGSATLPPEELPDRYTSKIRDKSIGKTDRSSSVQHSLMQDRTFYFVGKNSNQFV
jgi:hypothetical protein